MSPWEEGLKASSNSSESKHTYREGQFVKASPTEWARRDRSRRSSPAGHHFKGLSTSSVLTTRWVSRLLSDMPTASALSANMERGFRCRWVLARAGILAALWKCG